MGNTTGGMHGIIDKIGNKEALIEEEKAIYETFNTLVKPENGIEQKE